MSNSEQSSTDSNPTRSVLIVGAGEFGSATALSLLKKRYTDVTVIDKADTLPAADAASSDINKVVRWDYSGDVYRTLARKAIDVWSTDFKGIYFPSGAVVTGLEIQNEHGDATRNTWHHVSSGEPTACKLTTPEEFLGKLDPDASGVAVSPPDGVVGYFNPVGGWANATAAVQKLHDEITALGGTIVPGQEMTELLYAEDNKDVYGVLCASGKKYTADTVVMALGAWTASHPAIKPLLSEGLITATGHAIAMIQLSEDDWQQYKGIPVSMHNDVSGFYMLPPNEHGIVKISIHGAGYTTEDGAPRTKLDPDAMEYTESKGVSWIPQKSLRVLKDKLRSVYPGLASKNITDTRMCWYSDVPDGDWIVDYHEKYPSLLIASGGSGHAFKFLPVIGDIITERLEGTLEDSLKEKWSVKRSHAQEDLSRKDMEREGLNLATLATKRDLIAE